MDTHTVSTLMRIEKNRLAVEDLITRREYLRATPATPNLGAGLPNGGIYEAIQEINAEIARIIYMDLVERQDAF